MTVTAISPSSMFSWWGDGDAAGPLAVGALAALVLATSIGPRWNAVLLFYLSAS